MPFPEQRELRPLWRVRGPNLEQHREWLQGRLPANRDSVEQFPRGLADPRVEGRSSAGLLELRLSLIDLNEGIIRMDRFCGLVEQGQRIRVGVISRKGRLYRGEKSAKTAEGVVNGRCFITAVNHAVGTFLIAEFRTVILPLG